MCTTNIKFVLATILLALALTNAVAQDEIYRWVDDKGVVHFENQAHSRADAEQVVVHTAHSPKNQTALEAVAHNPEKESESLPSPAQQKRDERAKKRKETKEMNKLVAAMCEQSRHVVAQLEPMTRVMVEQPDGTVVRMDDNDRLERLHEEKAYIAKNCQ